MGCDDDTEEHQERTQVTDLVLLVTELHGNVDKALSLLKPILLYIKKEHTTYFRGLLSNNMTKVVHELSSTRFKKHL